MVVSCVIEFDQNPHGTYFAGQTLSGKITLQSDKVKQVKGVLLKINGFAHCHWTTSTTDTLADGKTETRTTNYIGHEDYIATTTYLLRSEENLMVNIEPGTHVYTFACFIPNECPSSFEALEGHIRYTVQVELIRPWKFNQTYTQGFTVLRSMDLNYESPMLRVPASSEISKTFCCGPCATEPLKLSATIPITGFVPGQNIPVSVLVTNDSSIKVEEVQVSLVMLVCFYSQIPVNTLNTNTLVIKLKGDPVPRNCKKLFNYDVPVPATPPTASNTCRILQIAYQVEVEAKVNTLHANQVVCIPVTIGNVPLVSVVQQQPTASSSGRDLSTSGLENGVRAMKQDEVSSQVMPMLDPGLSSPSSPWIADANIPPPSYEEAAHMVRGKINATGGNDFGSKDFAPRYPVFKITSQITTLDE